MEQEIKFKKNKLVSVIIPVYNVELYLERCLDSVIHQNYEELEIICVNDCSPDNSSAILEKYAEQDKRIKIINRKENGGLSAARNSGLDVAAGEYIYFIDSDDWIDLDYIEKMVEAAIYSKSPIVVNINILRKFQNVNLTDTPLFFGKLNIDKPQFVNSCTAINNIMWAACVHLWKKDFLDINNLKFLEGYIYEDMYFSPVAYSKTNTIYAINGPCYYYYIRENSICRNEKTPEENMNDFLKIFNTEFDFFVAENYIQKNSILLYPKDYINYSSNNSETYDLIYTYFTRIKEYVLRDRELYDKQELTYFLDILNELEQIKKLGYLKYHMLKTVRNSFNKIRDKKAV